MFSSQYSDQEYKNLEFNTWKMFTFGWYIVKNNFKEIAIITLLMAIPTNIIAEYIIANNLIPIREGVNGVKDTSHIFKISGIFFMSVAFLASLEIIRSFLLGGKKDIKEALTAAVKMWPALIGTGILYALCVFAGTILLIIPGIIVAVWFGFSFYFVGIEKISFLEALKESKKLVSGRWWKTLGMCIWFGIIAFVILGIPLFIIAGILGLMTGSESIIVSTILDTLLDIVGIPSTYVAVALFLGFQKFPPIIKGAVKNS